MADFEDGSGGNEPVLEPVAEPVIEPIDLDTLFKCGALRVVLELVGHQHGQRGAEGVIWVDVVLAKLNDISMKTVWDFISMVLMVNNRLARGGHWQLHTATLMEMLGKSYKMAFGAEPGGDEDAEVSLGEL
jgi:hypothetical protein